MNKIYRVEVRSPSTLSKYGRKKTEVVFKRRDGDNNMIVRKYNPSDDALDILDSIILFGHLLKNVQVYLFAHYISLAYTRKEQTT